MAAELAWHDNLSPEELFSTLEEMIMLDSTIRDTTGLLVYEDARSVGAGAEIIEEPVDQPYGVREYGARDPEGQLWYFHSPLD